MNAVGIDVSKGKSTVAVLCPFGEMAASPFDEDLFCESKSGFGFSINFSLYLLVRLLQFFCMNLYEAVFLSCLLLDL